LTVPQIAAYRRFWGISPPADVLIAAYLGYKGRDTRPKSDEEREQELERMAAALGMVIPDGR
jgi:hypothetical protein